MTHVKRIIAISCVAILSIGCLMAGCSNESEISYQTTGYETQKESYADQTIVTFQGIRTEKINDTIYAEFTNRSSATLDGTVRAYIYSNGSIAESAVLFLPSGGVSPGETVVISGIFHTVNGNYDDVRFVPNVRA